VLFGLLDAPKFTPCSVARFFGAHAAAHIFFPKQLQVRAQLGV
jgi:hypothetical protein